MGIDLNSVEVHRAAIGLRKSVGLADEDLLDPFDVLRSKVDLLSFIGLDGVLGATIRAPGLLGVALTTARDEHIQRFTAAHELGHITLGHAGSCLDNEQDVLGAARDERERAAQEFAASVLLPPRAVALAFRRYSSAVETTAQLAAAVYQTGRDLDVSYEATAVSLERYGLIRASDRRALKRVTPKQCKAFIGGSPPASTRSQLWRVQTDDLGTARLLPGDELILTDARGKWTSSTPTVEVVPTPEPGLRIRALSAGPWSVDQGRSRVTGRVRHLAQDWNSLLLAGVAA